MALPGLLRLVAAPPCPEISVEKWAVVYLQGDEETATVQPLLGLQELGRLWMEKRHLVRPAGIYYNF